MNNHLPNVIVIAGPTASGKTSLSLAVAELIPAEIVSADSRQIFKHLTIGTAKPTVDELSKAPHHFIDILQPDQRFNAGDFQVQGRECISGILSRERLPIVTGGTGLYVQAVVDGFFEQPGISGEVRSQLEQRLEQEGKDALYRELQSVDPRSARSMDASKYRRVIRALEVFHETGKPISQHHQEHTVEPVYNALFFGLDWDRAVLYDRINRRVETMLSDGFIEEVEKIRSMGFDDRFQSLQTVGYKEAFAFLRKEITKERMIELMKQNTRRFAKRQLTWFRREERMKWFKISAEDQLPIIARQIADSIQSGLQVK
ncbi:MAG: tRNA (adenosine(37)-N6)-dimethylallyltransferase MiaA [Bacteroidota bacterium]